MHLPDLLVLHTDMVCSHGFIFCLQLSLVFFFKFQFRSPSWTWQSAFSAHLPSFAAFCIACSHCCSPGTSAFSCLVQKHSSHISPPGGRLSWLLTPPGPVPTSVFALIEVFMAVSLSPLFMAVSLSPPLAYVSLGDVVCLLHCMPSVSNRICGSGLAKTGGYRLDHTLDEVIRLNNAFLKKYFI